MMVFSDWESNDRSPTDRTSYRSKNSNSRNSVGSQYLEDESENAGKSAWYLAPGNVSIVRYLSPRPGNPVKQNVKPSPNEEKQQEQETLGTYLKMNHDRATVKSWLNLRTAPEPQNKDTETDHNYCDANQANGRQFHELKKLSREQSLDEKYTCPATVTNIALHQTTPNDAPVDTEGYFNVNYPEALPRKTQHRYG